MGSDESVASMTPGPSSRSSKALDIFTPKSKNFRSRKLDYNKPLTVFRESDIDLDDNATLMMRSVPVVATGVDKEEEEVIQRIPTHMHDTFHMHPPGLSPLLHSLPCLDPVLSCLVL